MVYENDGSPLQGPSRVTAGQGTVRAYFRFFIYSFTVPITWTIVYQKICVQVIRHHRNREMPKRRGRRLAGALKERHENVIVLMPDLSE
jgi:hypothetical protein